MPDTPLGITYPAEASHTRLWEHFQTLAEDVDALLQARPKIVRGVQTVTLSSSSSATATVDYTAAGFTAAPVIIATGRNSQYMAFTGVPGTTSCSVGLRYLPGTNVSVSVDVSWVAIGV